MGNDREIDLIDMSNTREDGDEGEEYLFILD